MRAYFYLRLQPDETTVGETEKRMTQKDNFISVLTISGKQELRLLRKKQKRQLYHCRCFQYIMCYADNSHLCFYFFDPPDMKSPELSVPFDHSKYCFNITAPLFPQLLPLFTIQDLFRLMLVSFPFPAHRQASPHFAVG